MQNVNQFGGIEGSTLGNSSNKLKTISKNAEDKEKIVSAALDKIGLHLGQNKFEFKAGRNQSPNTFNVDNRSNENSNSSSNRSESLALNNTSETSTSAVLELASGTTGQIINTAYPITKRTDYINNNAIVTIEQNGIEIQQRVYDKNGNLTIEIEKTVKSQNGIFVAKDTTTSLYDATGKLYSTKTEYGDGKPTIKEIYRYGTESDFSQYGLVAGDYNEIISYKYTNDKSIKKESKITDAGGNLVLQSYFNPDNSKLIIRKENGIELERKIYSKDGSLAREIITTTEIFNETLVPKDISYYKYNNAKKLITAEIKYENGLPARKEVYTYGKESTFGDYGFSAGDHKEVISHKFSNNQYIKKESKIKDADDNLVFESYFNPDNSKLIIRKEKGIELGRMIYAKDGALTRETVTTTETFNEVLVPKETTSYRYDNGRKIITAQTKYENGLPSNKDVYTYGTESSFGNYELPPGGYREVSKFSYENGRFLKIQSNIYDSGNFIILDFYFDPLLNKIKEIQYVYKNDVIYFEIKRDINSYISGASKRFDKYALLKLKEYETYVLAKGETFADTHGKQHDVAVVWIDQNFALNIPESGFYRIEGQASKNIFTRQLTFHHWGIVKDDGSTINNIGVVYEESNNKWIAQSVQPVKGLYTEVSLIKFSKTDADPLEFQTEFIKNARRRNVHGTVVVNAYDFSGFKQPPSEIHEIRLVIGSAAAPTPRVLHYLVYLVNLLAPEKPASLTVEEKLKIIDLSFTNNIPIPLNAAKVLGLGNPGIGLHLNSSPNEAPRTV